MTDAKKTFPISFSPFYNKNTPLNGLYKKFLWPLLGLLFFGLLRYGWIVAAQVFAAWLGTFLTALAFSRARNKKMDQSFWITAFLLAGSLPAHLPLWMTFVGAAFGQFFSKEVFGGFGANVFNPALSARVFLTLNFPALFAVNWIIPKQNFGGATTWITQSITGATPLMKFRAQGIIPEIMPSFTGITSGSIFESSAILLILIMIYMYYKKIGDFKFSFSFLVSLSVFSGIGYLMAPTKILLPHLQLLTGGILSGAILFCTDPITGPRNNKSRYVCGVILGFLVLIIRSFSSFPEGFMYGLLLVNIFSPLIDQTFVDMEKNKKIKKPKEVKA